MNYLDYGFEPRDITTLRRIKRMKYINGVEDG